MQARNEEKPGRKNEKAAGGAVKLLPDGKKKNHQSPFGPDPEAVSSDPCDNS